VARLAIIVPHLGRPKLLEETLVSVLSNRPDDCEVLVVLGRAYDDPYELEGEVQFVRLPRRAGWVESLNAGIERSRAPVVHLLACGAEVAEGWADAALPHFDDPRVAAVAPLVLDQEHPEQVIAAGISYHMGGLIRALACGKPASAVPRQPRGVLAPHPAAAFYRRSILETVGRDHPLDGARRRAGERLAGIDLGLVLRQLGLRTVLEPHCRVAVRPEAMFRRGDFRDAMESERFFWRWASTIGLLRSLPLHGVLLTGESVRSLWNLSIVSRWAGRLAGVCLALGRRGVSGRVKQLGESLRNRPLDSAVKGPHFSMTPGRKKTPSGDVARREKRR
jgi:hypothetical protein